MGAMSQACVGMFPSSNRPSKVHDIPRHAHASVGMAPEKSPKFEQLIRTGILGNVETGMFDPSSEFHLFIKEAAHGLQTVGGFFLGSASKLRLFIC